MIVLTKFLYEVDFRHPSARQATFVVFLHDKTGTEFKMPIPAHLGEELMLLLDGEDDGEETETYVESSRAAVSNHKEEERVYYESEMEDPVGDQL